MLVRLLILLTGMLVSTVHASVTGSNMPFSADAVQQIPGEETHNARIFATASQVRMEYSRNGSRLVEIVDNEAGKSYLLLPSQKEYMMRELPAHLREPGKSAAVDANPCAGSPHAQCRQLGEERVSGRDATKWEMTIEMEGSPMRSLIWLDKERKLPVRQIRPDGTVIEMSLQEKELFDNRWTEKWQMLMTRPDGETLESLQWYDPELGIIIREKLPGGYFRELRNIRVGEQPSGLFQVPSDYRQVSPPRNLQPQTQGGMQR